MTPNNVQCDCSNPAFQTTTVHCTPSASIIAAFVAGTFAGFLLPRLLVWCASRSLLPTAATIDERFRPLSLFWDVRPLSNGARKVVY